MTSPDLIAADRAMREGDHERAAQLYKGLSYHGLEDASQRAHVEAQLAALVEVANHEAARARMARADTALVSKNYHRARAHYEAALVFGFEDSASEELARDALARVEALLLQELDSVANQVLDALASEPCKEGVLFDLGHLLSNPMGETSSERARALFASCAATRSRDPTHLTAILDALLLAQNNHPEWVSARRDALADVMLAGLNSEGARDVARVTSWLRASARETRWRDSSRADAIDEARARAAARVIDVHLSRATPEDPTCLHVMSARALHMPSSRDRVARACQVQIDAFLDMMEGLPAEDNTHLLTLDRVARKAPLTRAQSARVQRLLDARATPWRARASGASNDEARTFYAAVADAIDRRTTPGMSFSALRARLRSELQPPRVVAEVDVGGMCDTTREALLARAPSSDLGSDPAAVASVTLRCDHAVSARVVQSSIREVVTRNECKSFDVKSRSNAGFKCLETRDANTGNMVKDCRYGYNSRTETKVDTYEFCETETARLVTYTMEVCVKANIEGRGRLEAPDDRILERTSSSFRVDKCHTFTDTAPVGEESTPEEERGYVLARLRSQEAELVTRILAPLDAATSSFVEAEAKRSRARHDARISSDLSSADPDARIRGAIHRALLERAPFSAQRPLLNVVPDQALLRVLDGTRLDPPIARAIDALWALPAPRKPKSAKSASSRLRAYQDALLGYQKARPKVRRITSLATRPLTRTEWLSTGEHQHANLGAASVWEGRLERSDMLFDASIGWGRELLDDRTSPQMAWTVTGVFKRIGLGAGMKLDRLGGLTRGGHVTARWIGGPSTSRGHIDPVITWSVGATMDWTRLGGDRALSLRVPAVASVPILPRMSLDVGLEPDLVHLFSLAAPLGMTPDAARSMAWLGTTWSLLQGRLAIHANLGPSINATRADALTGRAAIHFRF